MGFVRVLTLCAVLAPIACGQGFAVWQVTPPTGTQDLFGTSLAIVADVNFDGVRDVLAGAPLNAFAGFPHPTYALVLSGADGSILRAHLGATPFDGYGTAVAELGDLNGDGMTEMAIGSPGPSGPTAASHVEVRSGGSGAVLFTITSPSVDAAGSAIAATSDVNGDGIPDFFVGAPDANPLGQVRLHSGADGSVLQTYNPPANNLYRLGASVASAGDVDGDSWPDVIAGAPGAANSSNITPGKVLIFSGATGVPLLTMTGSFPGDRFGVSIVNMGHFDGDAIDDFAIGLSVAGTSSPANPPHVPVVEIRSGATGAVLASANGVMAEELGSAMANAGDLDGDGRVDLAVGAPRALGPAGPYTGRVTVLSGATLAPLFNRGGPGIFSFFGSGLAAGVDLTGDGVPEVVGGAIYKQFASLPGTVVVMSVTGDAGSGLAPLGTACPGTGGLAPAIGATGVPSLGNATFGIAVARALGGSQAFLFASTTAALSGYAIGGGCSAYLGGSPFQVAGPLPLSGPAGAAGAGHAIFTAPVPGSGAFVGLGCFVEWGVLDPGGPLGGVSVSPALGVTIF
jgi:hypothetical protein